MFFHTNVDYKEYKNDLAELDKIPDDKLIEIGNSFDKPYPIIDRYNILPAEINKTWHWIDTFSDEDIEKFKDEVDNYDFKACYINEENVWAYLYGVILEM